MELDMKVNVPIKIVDTVNITKITISLKVGDKFNCILYDENDNPIVGYDGYVPNEIVPGRYGDYFDLEIDMDTGKILNWHCDSDALADFIKRYQGLSDE